MKVEAKKRDSTAVIKRIYYVSEMTMSGRLVLKLRPDADPQTSRPIKPSVGTDTEEFTI